MKYLVEWFSLSYDTDEPAPGKPFKVHGRFKSLLFDLPEVSLALETDGEIARQSGDFEWKGPVLVGVTVEMSATLVAPGVEKWEIDPGAPALGVPETIRIPGTVSLVVTMPFPYDKLVTHVGANAAEMYPDERLREELLEELAAMNSEAEKNNGRFRFGRGSSISLYLETWSFKKPESNSEGEVRKYEPGEGLENKNPQNRAR